jgi:hypothetical protein
MIKLKEILNWPHVPVNSEAISHLHSKFPTISFSNISGHDDWDWVFNEKDNFLALSYRPWRERVLPIFLTVANRGAPDFHGLLCKSLWGKKYQKSNLPPLVIDATGGLLKDAMDLRFFTSELWIFERHPLLQILITHFFNYIWKKDPWLNTKIQFYPQDFLFLTVEKDPGRPWQLYYDPMFEDDAKSLPSSSMQLMQKLMEETDNAPANPIEIWERWKTMPNLEKIIIKRSPKSAPFFGHVGPTYSLHSKLLRLDIYQL